MTSSGVNGRYAPFFVSNRTALSKHSRECHLPFSTFKHRISPSLHSSVDSVIRPSSSKNSHLILPRRIMTVSDEAKCLCIATSVPGTMAFSIRYDPSSADVLRSKFVLNRGFPFACSNKLSSIVLSIIITLNP